MTRLVMFVLQLLEQHHPTWTRQDTGVNVASRAAYSSGRPGHHTLTERQQRILGFVAEYVADNGFAPNDREIAEGTGLKSRSSAHYHLHVISRRLVT
jgi:hypothetical protein